LNKKSEFQPKMSKPIQPARTTGLHRAAITVDPVSQTALPIVQEVLRSPGQSLDTTVRAFLEPRFGHDFSNVRVHTDDRAATSARAVNALAYTVGSHIAFDTGLYRPNASDGKQLLAHELTHVVQQHGQTPTDSPPIETAPSFERQADAAARTVAMGRQLSELPLRVRSAVQRAVSPEDVAIEMVGKQFTLSEPSGALTTGDTVTVASWSNASDTVSVSHPKLAAGPIDVPKRIIRPVRTAVAGVDPYSAGVDSQAQAVAKNEKQLADWMAKEPQYKTAKQKKAFGEEKTRLEGLLTKRKSTLNRRLIQETMFNRFDAVIKREVDAANTAHGLKGKDALDPNLLKSMLFQESQLGTSGTHLEVPPSHPVKTRFNLGQVIDSSAMALLTLFEREQPAVMTTYSLTGLRADLAKAQREREDLKKKATRSVAEEARLTELNRLSGGSWETFIWEYTGTGASKGFNDAVTDFFAGAAPARNEDYEFWIHMAVLWLFEKHKSGMSWPETIRAYNGSGARAEHYRDAVVKRAGTARAAATKKTDFVPGGI
jgi:hypothetical protein